MTFWTYQNLADFTNGTWLVPPDDLSAEVTGLWHDTRDIQPGQAYLAIKGDNFDGHAFLDKAFDAGAALAIVSETPAPNTQHPAPILKVADTVKALQDLARAYRDELSKGRCKVIGIAGSNGKTTTRHLIHHVLTHAGLKGTQSPKSFNNHLGVPLTLLSGKPQDDFVAAEIGTNHPGEIDFLSAIARPDIAVITSIGEEHMEFFKDIDGVAKEELSIIDRVVNHGDVVLGDFRNWLDEARGLAGTRVKVHRFNDEANQPPSSFPLLGMHNHQNAAMAGAVAHIIGARFPDWYDALGTVRAPDHRGVLISLGQSTTLIDDCYNANPSSMWSALRILGQQVTDEDSGRKVAILGDMFELGDQAIAGHQEVGEDARDSDVDLDRLICIGQYAPVMAKAFDPERSDIFPEWSGDLPDQIAALLEPGDTVLLKASRGMRLERLIPAIERRFGPTEQE